MKSNLLFGLLLCQTFAVTGASDPIERYYACMFASYYDWQDCQPSCALVRAIAKGKQSVPRKLMRFYRDEIHPRCPEKLRSDLEALTDCCFLGTLKRGALRDVLERFWATLPEEDALDLRQLIRTENLAQMWACLTWYALCVDSHEESSY